jgi:hypothetical protein
LGTSSKKERQIFLTLKGQKYSKSKTGSGTNLRLEGIARHLERIGLIQDYFERKRAQNGFFLKILCHRSTAMVFDEINPTRQLDEVKKSAQKYARSHSKLEIISMIQRIKSADNDLVTQKSRVQKIAYSVNALVKTPYEAAIVRHALLSSLSHLRRSGNDFSEILENAVKGAKE